VRERRDWGEKRGPGGNGERPPHPATGTHAGAEVSGNRDSRDAGGQTKRYLPAGRDDKRKGRAPVPDLMDHKLVARARNHPNCLVLPFRLYLIRLAVYSGEVKCHRLAISVEWPGAIAGAQPSKDRT
jgi:hypothetical protein